MRQIIIVLTFLCIGIASFGQEVKDSMNATILRDDSVRLAMLLNKDSIDSPFPNPDSHYSLLSQAVRSGAVHCFNLLIQDGANPNAQCNGYVPPIMHAAKYGRLYMLKVLIAKGANPNYVYEGDYTDANGKTPLEYAEEWKQPEVADYLRSLKASH